MPRTEPSNGPTQRDVQEGMSDLPSAWGQAFPRAVRLVPGDLLVPERILRIRLAKSKKIELGITGWTLQGTVQHGGRLEVEIDRKLEVGDLVLCSQGAWADVRRVLNLSPSGRDLMTALDPYPSGRELIDYDRVIGVVTRRRGAGDWLGALAARCFPLWSRIMAFGYWCRKIVEAPDFGARGVASIEAKYQDQVESYVGIVRHPLGEEILEMLRRHFPHHGDILVAGAGTGREALHLAREGYAVTGFDLVPAMVQASRQTAKQMGLEAEFFVADMATLDLSGRRFAGAYITPLVYSFVPTRSRRVECLWRLGRHLAPGGKVVLSADLIRGTAQFVRAVLVSIVRLGRGTMNDAEFGDWYTWFLTPQGDLATSFSRRFLVRQVNKEAREAGFHEVVREGRAHFVLGDFRA